MNTLSDLLATLQRTDQDLLELSEDELRKVGELLADKVDAYYYLLEKIDLEQTRLSERIKQLRDNVNTLQNKASSLRGHMLYHMKEKGFEKLRGDDVSVSRLKRQTCVLKPWLAQGVFEADLVNFRPYIKTSHDWDLRAIREAVLANPEDTELKRFGTVEEMEYLRFNLKKDLK